MATSKVNPDRFISPPEREAWRAVIITGLAISFWGILAAVMGYFVAGWHGFWLVTALEGFVQNVVKLYSRGG